MSDEALIQKGKGKKKKEKKEMALMMIDNHNLISVGPIFSFEDEELLFRQ